MENVEKSGPTKFDATKLKANIFFIVKINKKNLIK